MDYGKGSSETQSIEILTAILGGIIRFEEVKLELFMICRFFVKGSIGGYVFNWNSVKVDFETHT